MSGLKFLLTNESGKFYDSPVTARAVMELQKLPIQLADNRQKKILAAFLCPVDDSYVQAFAKGCHARIQLSGFFDHRTPTFKKYCLRGLLRISTGVKQMTAIIVNTTESTLQSLYRYYSEIKLTWYKGKYTLAQEDLYYGVFSALEDALMKLPTQCPEDRKIKLAMLKNFIQAPLETNKGVDLSLATNREVEALELIEQIAAE